MGRFAIELGEVFHLEELFDVTCSDLGDDRDKRVEPRLVDLDVDVWPKVDGYVGVDALVSRGLGLISVWWDQICWRVCVACVAS